MIGRATLQAILSLEFIPSIVQGAEHGTGNHALLGGGVGRNLHKDLSSVSLDNQNPPKKPPSHQLKKNKIKVTITYLVRMHLGNALHILDLDLSGEDQVGEGDFLPATAVPQRVFEAGEQGAQIRLLAALPRLDARVDAVAQLEALVVGLVGGSVGGPQLRHCGGLGLRRGLLRGCRGAVRRCCCASYGSLAGFGRS